MAARFLRSALFVTGGAFSAAGQIISQRWTDLGVGCCPQIDSFIAKRLEDAQLQECQAACVNLGTDKCGFILFNSLDGACNISVPELRCQEPLSENTDDCHAGTHSFRFSSKSTPDVAPSGLDLTTKCECDGKTCYDSFNECLSDLGAASSYDSNPSGEGLAEGKTPESTCKMKVFSHCNNCRNCLGETLLIGSKFDAHTGTSTTASPASFGALATLALGAAAAAALAVSAALLVRRRTAAVGSTFRAAQQSDVEGEPSRVAGALS